VAAASQSAAVGNLGLALANTGLNAAIAGGGLAALPASDPGANLELVNAQEDLAQFIALLTNLDWLTSANPFEQFAQTVHLDGLTLTLGGNLQGTEFLVGWDENIAPDGGPIPGGVRVRQISGVLDIGISISDSGNNVVIGVVQNDVGGTAGPGISGPAGLDVSSSLSAVVAASPSLNTAVATIETGDATAVGNKAVVMVCQAFNDDTACAPKVTPGPQDGGEDPDDPPPASPGNPSQSSDPAPAVETSLPPSLAATDDEPGAASTAGMLPLTGGDTRELVGAGVALLAAGGLLARRRRGLGSRLARDWR
jgi:LPXTG-motif cell wall-anchored protein